MKSKTKTASMKEISPKKHHKLTIFLSLNSKKPKGRERSSLLSPRIARRRRGRRTVVGGFRHGGR